MEFGFVYIICNRRSLTSIYSDDDGRPPIVRDWGVENAQYGRERESIKSTIVIRPRYALRAIPFCPTGGSRLHCYLVRPRLP
jgi:hypothetical protein